MTPVKIGNYSKLCSFVPFTGKIEKLTTVFILPVDEPPIPKSVK